MSENRLFAYKKAARIQIVVCGFLFVVFSFVYLYVFQQYILEALHFSLAHGKTHFTPMASAIIITLVLLLLRWGVNSLMGLKGPIRTLSYFPSFLLLGVLTDVGRGVLTDGYHTVWGWLLPLVLLLYVVIVFPLRRYLHAWLNAKYTDYTLMNANIIILLAFSIMTVMIGNTNANFHHELEMEHYMRIGKYDKALKVGRLSQEATRTITALRAYSLARTGELGDRLFEYPQYYKSDGLLFANDSLATFRYTNDSIFSLLGARPYNGERCVDFLRSVCYKDIGGHVSLDYYLSALLLDKRIDDFVLAISDFFEIPDSLSRYYQEALVVYQWKHPAYSLQLKDSTLLQSYSDYQAESSKWDTRKEKEKALRDRFGKTYWWYYDFQD